MLKTKSDDLDILEIKSIDHPINASMAISPSKSLTHRAFLIASLASGTSKIINPLLSGDTLLTLKALKAMGVEVTNKSDGYIIQGTSGNFHSPKEEIFLENSGSSIRFLTTIASLANGEIILTGNARLCERPIRGLVNALHSLGVKITYLKKSGFPPLKVLSRLRGGNAFLKGDTSSQYFSSILMGAPYANNDVVLKSKDIKSISSRPYIDITIDVMKNFGIQVRIGKDYFHVSNNQSYKAKTYRIEGDFTNASYFFAASAILSGKIQIFNLNRETRQGDISFLAFLDKMGCQISYKKNSIILERTQEEPLNGIDVNMRDYPDLIPTLAIVACFATTPTKITSVRNLKFKESNRLSAIITELKKVGAKIEVIEDSLIIYPIKNPRSAIIETYNDHRIAMCFSVLGLKIPGISIRNPVCVKKSFPTFYEAVLNIN